LDSGAPAVSLPATVTVTPAAANQLAFVPAPPAAVSGPFSFIAGNTMQPTAVAVEDQYGNLLASSSATITVTSSAPLTGTLSKAASHGIAVFSDISATLAGLGYTFVASSAGLTPASSAFNIPAAAANHLSFDTQPSDTVVNAVMSPNIVVGVYDVYGNAASDVASMNLDFGNNPRNASGFADSDPVNVLNGKATFTGFGVFRPAVGDTLVATGGSLSVESNAFDITLPVVRPLSNAGSAWQTLDAGGPLGTVDFNWYNYFAGDSPPAQAPTFISSNSIVGSAFDAGTQAWVWDTQQSSDPRALDYYGVDDAGAAWFGTDFTDTVTVPAGSTELTMYLVDWDDQGRSETITVDDGTGLQPVHLSTFTGGAYVSAPISNTATTVTLHLHSDAGPNAVISGIFVD
jgi:hypothetical protein